MNTRKRKSPSIKFVIKMLVWMLIGGILGFAMSWFGGQADNVGQFFAVVVRSVQSAMIPLVTLVTVSGILFGEIVLKKIKQIEERLRYAEDEECDELEYQEEYIGAWGLNGSNFAMALAILINSVGYSRNYISGSRETAFRFMIAVVIFVVCFFYEGCRLAWGQDASLCRKAEGGYCRRKQTDGAVVCGVCLSTRSGTGCSTYASSRSD